MATTEEFTAIVRKLGEVSSAGQARAACGAAAAAARAAYDILPRLRDDLEAASRTELDQRNFAVGHFYRTIEKMSAQAEIRETFHAGPSSGRKLIEGLYITIGGIEAAANHKPQTSNLQILAASIAEAPAVFGQAVGAAAGEVGKVAGGAAGGILAGLGISGTLTLAVVAIVILLVVTRGTILGRLFGGGAS